MQISDSLSQEFAFDARAAALAGMRRRVGEILREAGCGDAEIETMVIAVNEACMNIIQHAYHGNCSKPIRVAIDADGDCIRFELLDCAAPIALDQVCGRSFDELRPGGLGVNFIREVMQDVRYCHRSESAGNCLRMTWRRTAPEA